MKNPKEQIEAFIFSLPLYINNLEKCANSFEEFLDGMPLKDFLNTSIDRYTINSNTDAFVYLAHYIYNKNKKHVDRTVDEIEKKINLANKNYSGIRDIVLDIYKKIGLVIDSIPDITVVDTFPKPFHKLKNRALAPDNTDQKRYDIPNTMYIRKSVAKKVYMPILISHELFHYHIKDCGLLARGIEEALADFVSVFVFGANFFGKTFALNYYTEMRYARGATTQRFDLYTDDLMRLLLFLDHIGWDAISQLCREGREALKKLDHVPLRKWTKAELCKQYVPEIDSAKSLLQELIIQTPRNQILSPIAVTAILGHETQKFSMSNNLRKVALEEIQNRIFGVLMNDDVIDFDDFALLVSEGAIIVDARAI